ncbi:hypothetical protein COS59_01115 [Candidatus Wolfebacteria bacterium CG03_land_8_20_14_0_80_36_15]|uniref:LTD domain-containing protein n=1 Tax=Candidatus Wolfebacteria bacterium CG03_land_8_20_14_0_80_36_15 TaxID=1975067 RepID=A0A2M7B7T6_9BACT|nr:MAG: hypothetical protein COS59_01115 [Candidatus Wolfebacteria bacterium CG03_land_8_20_14_0_80_36_15]
MVFFYEVLPNPVGKDTGAEWIKLYNPTNEPINLSGWQIKDASAKTFIFKEKEITPNGFLTLSSEETKIILNNSGDSLFLYDQNNQLIDKASYDVSVAEGDILHREGNSFILDQAQTISLTENQSLNQTAVIGQRLVPAELGLAISFILVLSLVFLIIIKKINLFNED